MAKAHGIVATSRWPLALGLEAPREAAVRLTGGSSLDGVEAVHTREARAPGVPGCLLAPFSKGVNLMNTWSWQISLHRSVSVLLLLLSVACSTDDSGAGGSSTDAGDTTTADGQTGGEDTASDTAGSSDVGSGSCDDGTGPLACNDGYELPSFDKCCETAADCALVYHQRDCCGSMNAIGVNSDEVARFDELHPECRGSYPGCGCPAMNTLAEDGSTADIGQTITVDCVQNACVTAVSESE